eukprot:366518-Chlamydomonas_euryale.AAC.11
MFEEYFLCLGGSIGYWQGETTHLIHHRSPENPAGDVTKLLDDIAALKPSIFIGVPRVFDRIYARIMGQVNSASVVKRSLFNLGLWTKLYFMRQGWKHGQVCGHECGGQVPGLEARPGVGAKCQG